MKKHGLFFICTAFLFMVSPASVLSQEFRWATGIGGQALPYSVCSDAQGNSYVTGSYYSQAIFSDSDTLNGRGSHDIFVAKYDPDGLLLWARSAGGGGWDSGEGIGVDEDGNVYVTGYLEEIAIFGDDTIQSMTYYYWDIFLAKYNSEGSLMWVKTNGGYDDDCGAALTVHNGNIYVAGTINRIAFFDNDTLYCGYDVWSNDVFVACYAPDGECVWAKLGAGDRADYVNDIHADPNGNIYITGSFASGDLTFGSTTILRSSGSMYVAKYFPNGDLAWARANGGSNYITAHGVAADAEGNYYVAGDFRGSAYFDSTTLSNYGEYDFFLLRFGPDGNCHWAKHAGCIYYDYGHDVEIGKDGKIYASGRCYTNSYFDDIRFTSLGGVDVALACYDTLGKCEWVLRGGGRGGDDYGRALSIAQNGMIYVTGETALHASFPATFGSTNLYNIHGVITAVSPVSEHAAVLADLSVASPGTDSIRASAVIDDAGYPSATQHGFCWSDSGIPDAKGPKIELGAILAPGTFHAVIRDLLSDHAYLIRAFAINTADTVYSDTVSFRTLGLPLLANPAATEIDTGGAVLRAEITGTGNPLPGAHGFCWNTGGTPTLDDAHIDLGAVDSIGTFQSAVTGLVPNTEYRFRAFAVNSLGTVYSQEGTFSTLEVSRDRKIPETFTLSQNFPNPFNPRTAFRYGLSLQSDVTFTIFTLSGQKLREWTFGDQDAGWYELLWDGTNASGETLPSGLYLYRLRTGNFIETRKMLLMK